MTQAEMLKKAYRLYKAYKTTTSQYRDLADSLGYTIGELNSKFSRKYAMERYPMLFKDK